MDDTKKLMAMIGEAINRNMLRANSEVYKYLPEDHKKVPNRSLVTGGKDLVASAYKLSQKFSGLACYV